ncbi:SlyX family protein [Proteobacteria bacterium 005FR1]|nr:SlyX family protein [Proteobacteria bacterium 005FR1]
MDDLLLEQIIELQTKVQFQEDALHKLDEVVVQQSGLIDRLHRKVKELEDRMEQLRYERSQPQDLGDEKPPHY